MDSNTHSGRQSAKFVFFGMGRAKDARYLDLWRDVPLNYRLRQAVDASFHSDEHEAIIMPKATPRSFGNAADLLLRYQFYPPTLMLHVSDFSRENRAMRVGDRVMQRINGLALVGVPLPIMEGLTMNECATVIDEPRRKGFTYVTTTAHFELGEWSAQIEWRADEALVLTIRSLSRAAYFVPGLFQRMMRRGQKRAHQMGIAYFTAKVLAGGR